MDNFFEDKKEQTTNPFAKGFGYESQKQDTEIQTKPTKRLNIIDMEVFKGDIANSQIEFIENKMNNLQQLINQRPQTLDPISLEKIKIEWEDLRLQLYKLKNSSKTTSDKKKRNNLLDKISFICEKLSKIFVFTKLYSPKVKEFLSTYSEINKEFEDLVKKATPLGEEDMKYGLLVNKIYQASKLNCKISNEIK